MRVHVVERPAEDDLLRVEDFDASFTTDTIYEITASVGGFSLTEQQVSPRFKRYDLLAAYRDAVPSWDALLLATAGAATVGLAATTYQPWHARQVLNEMHVTPRRRRQGVARALLAEVIDIARRNGAREVWVETQNVNHPAVQAYLRLGFRLTGLDTTLYGGDQEREVALFLAREIGAPSGQP